MQAPNQGGLHIVAGGKVNKKIENTSDAIAIATAERGFAPVENICVFIERAHARTGAYV